MKSRRSSKIVASILMLAVGLSVACNRDSQTNATAKQGEDLPPRQLFGVELQPQARALLAEIEQHYGKRLREDVKSNLDYSYYAALASVDSDGTPSIRMDSDIPATESTIVHELLHIKLYSKGFPVIRLNYPQSLSTERQQAHVRYIVAMLYDAIIHTIIYPQAREMGLKPQESLHSQLDLIMADQFEDYAGVPRQDVRTIYYLNAALLLDDRELFERVTDAYIRRHWYESVAIGRVLADMVAAAKPSTPEEVVFVLLRCLEVIQHEINNFELEAWQNEKRGEHILRRAVIKVIPQQRTGK
ncbi:MAG TPA: hypothetical protein VM911_07030 [Pyrinomonadaceae bacterium]|nr:hypothetical protein [Pyrinomonadaceae bacterium]